MGWFADEDGGEARLEGEGGGEAVFGAWVVAGYGVALAGDPVAQVAVGEGLQAAAALAVLGGELVVVDQGVEAVLAAVPDVPDEGPVVEELAVLREEAVRSQSSRESAWASATSVACTPSFQASS